MQSADTTKRLQKLFKLTFKKDAVGIPEVVPAIDYGENKQVPVQFTTDIQRQFNEWKNDLVSNDDLKNRIQRYNDIDFMIQNCGYIRMAVKLYASETITPDESGKLVGVYSRNKDVEKYINEFLPKIGINRSILENTSYDLSSYGDSVWIRAISPTEGITEIVPIDVRQLQSRIEFSSIDELTKEMQRNNWQGYSSMGIQFSDITKTLNAKLDTENYTAMFKRYLFGFAIGGDLSNSAILPPWAVSHFRRFTTKSEFVPYGRPLLIDSLGLFREYKSDLNLLSMARVAKFPKEVYSVAVSPTMSPIEKVQAVNNARQAYENLIGQGTGKEEMGIGSSIWTAKDTIEYELLENNMDLGDVADVDLVKDELITSTLIPKGYLISSDSSWGESGKSLLQQAKLPAREVYTNQTAILSEITDLIKTQFVLLNLFDGDKTEFELTLPFPNSEQTSENIDIQKDTMDLANATIDNLKTALAIDSIPIDVAKEIFKKYSSIDTKDLDAWFKKIDGTVDLEIDQVKDDSDIGDSTQRKNESLSRALSRLNENVFREAYFDAKKSNTLIEGILNNNHYYFSYQSNSIDTLKYTLMQELEPGTTTPTLKD